MNIAELLEFGNRQKASDLHLSAGEQPMLRIHGDLRRINLPLLSPQAVHDLIYEVMNDAQRKQFEENLECDFAFDIQGLARYRVNAFLQNRGPAAVFRQVPHEVISLDKLGGPRVLKQLCEYPSGIVLVTGPTGSGKSTTLASMVDFINVTRQAHILTIEDPIEFVHQNRLCLISQRELGQNTLSFSNALRSALREDPDIILVGELRDLETIRLALTAAETGHLVFATLHTSSAAKTIDRIVDVFPAEEKEIIRIMLSESLRAVVSQRLLKNKEGDGRIAVHEILVGTFAIRNLIRENKIAQMMSAMQTGQQHGMQTLDQALVDVFKRGLITADTARQYASVRDLFNQS